MKVLPFYYPVIFLNYYFRRKATGIATSGQPLARSNTGSPRFTDFPLLCACSESSLTNLMGSGLDLLCLQIHSKPECRWTWPGVPIFPAYVKRDPWGRGCISPDLPSYRKRKYILLVLPWKMFQSTLFSVILIRMFIRYTCFVIVV